MSVLPRILFYLDKRAFACPAIAAARCCAHGEGLSVHEHRPFVEILVVVFLLLPAIEMSAAWAFFAVLYPRTFLDRSVPRTSP